MKQSINLGAYGWRHRHWLNSFYPEDLPVEADGDWRLSYYSNEFNAVLLPIDYWQENPISDCEDWLDSVHSEFQFFVECDAGMFDRVSPADLSRALKILAPQLSALVFLDEEQAIPGDLRQQFMTLADSLGIELLGLASAPATTSHADKIWRPGGGSVLPDVSRRSNFAFIEDELTDLRSVRAMVEQFALCTGDDAGGAEATIIVNHPQLLAGNLSKFRSVLDIMGY